MIDLHMGLQTDIARLYVVIQMVVNRFTDATFPLPATVVQSQ